MNAVKPMRFPTSDFRLLENDTNNFVKDISIEVISRLVGIYIW